MDIFEFIDKENKRSKNKGSGKIKFAVFIFFVIIGFTIGLSLGFFLGAVSLVYVIEDFSEGMNASIIIDFDEEVAMNYMIKYMEDEYNLIEPVALKNTSEVNMIDNKKIIIDNETRTLLEEAKTHPEQREISQTQQDFIPPEMIYEIEATKKQMEVINIT